MKTSLFDVQVNGFFGADFQDPNLKGHDLREAVIQLARHQTRRFFVALITDSIDRLESKFRGIEGYCEEDSEIASAISGYHLEGPWLLPKPGFRGAHPPQHMRPPDIEEFDRLQEAARGRIRLVTLAPEWEDSPRFIRALASRGVEVSLGHTDASSDEIEAAVEAGARFVTHLGNGVPMEMHRHDNIVQRLLSRDELLAFFIPDGVHLPPEVLKNFVRAKPKGSALFTTDCMAAAGAPNGRYRLGDLELEVGEDRIVRLPGTSHFAGSALCPDQGMANLMNWLGWTEIEAREACSTRVASLFGIDLPTI